LQPSAAGAIMSSSGRHLAVMRLDVPMDVPSPTDFSRVEEAQGWADAANVERPWRADFFAAIVHELVGLRVPSASVLELGSGPGFLAERVLQELPDVTYTLLDSSAAMQELAHVRVGQVIGVRFVTADFRRDHWADGLGSFDAVTTVQAVHELRHKRHAVGLHRAVYGLLRCGGLYLVCDHLAGPRAMADHELYMTVSEQADALACAGFADVSVVLETGGLVLHRGRK
jgi:ubiquinone/menaquinone biosynthesis C-methylase UbiE